MDLRALLALGQVGAAHFVEVYIGLEMVGLESAASALQEMNTAVHLKDAVLLIPCFTEVSIYVRSHCKQVIPLLTHLLRQLSDDLKPFMRLLLSVHLQSRPIEAPEEIGVGEQKVGVGAYHEVELIAIGRVSLPKSLVSSEIRQTGVSAEPCACPDNDSITLLEKLSSLGSHLHSYNINEWLTR